MEGKNYKIAKIYNIPCKAHGAINSDYKNIFSGTHEGQMRGFWD